MSNDYIVAKAIRDLDVSKALGMPKKFSLKKKKQPSPMSDGDWKSTMAGAKKNPFSSSNIAMGMKPMANPFSSLTGGPKTVMKSDGVAKGFLTPVKGIKGGALTRRFPEFTSSGKRQLAAKKAQRVSDSSLESASRLRSAQQSAANNADDVARSRRTPKFKKPANTGSRLPADMQGSSSRSYF